MSTALAQAFCQALTAELAGLAGTDPGLTGFAEQVGAATCHDRPVASPPQQAPAAHAHLDKALAGLACGAPLAHAIRAMAPTIDWYQMFTAHQVGADLAAGLVVGRPELAPDAPQRTGLFLLGPGIHYPAHQHKADEVYYVVSGHIEIQHGTTGTPFPVGAGQWSITPSDRVHGLRNGDAPCLIAYVITGNLEAPVYWWARDARDGWSRTRWDRTADGRWTEREAEQITPALWAAAGEKAGETPPWSEHSTP